MIRRCLVALLFVSSVSVLRADDTSDFLKPENWEGLKKYWTVDGKTITGKADPGLTFNTFLCTKETYTDFELSFKVKLTGKTANSGVQIRSKLVEREKFVVGGPQCDMGQVYWGSLYGERFGADGKIPGGGHMMKACAGDFVKKHVKENEFNDYTLTVKGKNVKIVINGATSVEGDFKILPSDGIIALQMHAGQPMEVVYKDIQFKKLK
ncbi:MAG: DUF1080 domain-containing protein [Gemmataceae bacterium]